MPLFNPKTIQRHIERAEAPDPAKLAILADWAKTIRDGSIETQKETALHGDFKQKIVCEVLGYQPFNETGDWTVATEAAIGSGAVDLALGNFTTDESKVIAPFELKGAKTKDLEAIMPGRAKTPVQQAWDYAADNFGTKWVLVSNYLEIRLYSYADGRQFYEGFDLAKLHQPEEYQRFILLLSADNLLSGKTAEVLAASKAEDKDITNKLYSDYKALRSELIDAVRTAKPDLDPLDAIRFGQTILDRVLFIAFAEDNGLLPDRSLERAFEHSDPYNPRPVWQNFLGLFAAINEGSDQLNIPRYNGGLFKRDDLIRSLEISDDICEGFKRLGAYDFASEISVTVLGHIFEQSIADVEQLQAEARGEAPVEKKASGTSGRRKRDGVVYTPDYIARFIVDQTLGTHCREIFNTILAKYAAKGATADDDPIKWKSTAKEKQAWQAYRDRLTALRIVDPACGSGVFLIMAFDYLKAELHKVNAKLAELEGGYAGDLFDPDSEILTNNLFGVDVNSESVEIAKLSLWIKTARRGKVLDSLDGNLRVGDSLIEDSSYAYREHGFVWKEAFPEVFVEGGFDVVLGNPPYVRMELIKPMKPWLEKRFQVVSDRADLYAYFFERGITLLKPGGRLGYISSATFFKTGSGAPLRDFLRKNAIIESVVDFGDLQIFEGVTTYPAILTMLAGEPDKGHELQFWNIVDLPAGSFADGFESTKVPFPQRDLQHGYWQLEAPDLRALRAKIVEGRKTLREVYGPVHRGIVTGLNKAFILNQQQYDALVSSDPKSAEILLPFQMGVDFERWIDQGEPRWIIYTPKGKVRIELYPAVAEHLSAYRQKLESRATKQEWFELQQAQDAYFDKMRSAKIAYNRFLAKPEFHFEASGKLINDAPYFIPTEETWLTAYLNGWLAWWFITGRSTPLRGGYYQLLGQHVEPLPIPNATEDQKYALGELAEGIQAIAEERYALQQRIGRRIPDLAPDPAVAKLSTKLKEWWRLPDFAAFQKEVKKSLKAEIPLKERSEWEDWINDTRGQINALTAEIERLEGEVNARVYELFDLTPEEIELLEANI